MAAHRPDTFGRWARMLRSVALGLALLGSATITAANTTTVSTPQAEAQLTVHAPEGLGVGRPAWLGLVIKHQPGWHTYWKNPGDSGLATQLTWQLPAGAAAGEIAWPTPQRMVVGSLANYGYEGTVLLPVPLTVAQGYVGQTVSVKLKAEWLVCQKECIPQDGDFEIAVPIGVPSTPNAALFSQAFAAQPQAHAVKARGEVGGEVLTVTTKGLPDGWAQGGIGFFPEQPGITEPAADVKASQQADELVLRVPLSSQRSESPASMRAVITRPGQAAGISIDFAVSDWSNVAAQADSASLAPEAAEIGSSGATGLLVSLALAFAGGLLLNLMPCVFPILSLKILSFAQHAGDRKALIAGGLAYTVGVVASFVALAGGLLALRAGGEALGWGFQLQSPAVVTALAVLFTLIALNLFGVFEFGTLVPSGLAMLRARSPMLDHGLTGVLAVGVASPCTAPFMGVALGAALTMPLAQALSVFAALGLGMAAPYLLASAWPGLSNLLPRPGAWMARFKVLMAFPMLATVVWLVWVLAQQVGIDGAAATLALLVALAFGTWTYGLPGAGTASARLYKAAGALVVAAALVWVSPFILGAQPGAVPETADKAMRSAPTAWRSWSPQAVTEARAAGQPVFVDFTAAWCVSCQVNKRTTLNDAALLAELRGKGVLLLRADWTNRDPVITEELARLGRSGVPVYALYEAGTPKPRLLPEILTVATVRDAVAHLPTVSPITSTSILKDSL